MDFYQYESLVEEIEGLKEEAEGSAIIVEGKRDKKALRFLGLDEDYVLVNGEHRVPIVEQCERIRDSYERAILFVDIDRAGNALAKKLRHHLSQMGVKLVEKYRISLLKKLDTEQVEHIPVRMQRLEEDLFPGHLAGY